MLIKNLPPESATAAALRVEEFITPTEITTANAAPPAPEDVEGQQWSRTDQLIASVRDELHLLRWLYNYAHNNGRKPKWEPEPLMRPGVHASKKKKPLDDAQTSFLAGYLARTQGADEDVTYN